MISLNANAGRLMRYRERAGGVECAFAGTLFENDLSQLRIDLLRHLEQNDVRWMSLDLRQATLIVGESSAFPLLFSSAEDAPLRLRPVAIVVKPEIETLCLQWQWEMAHGGFVRGVFLDPHEALRWCRSRMIAQSFEPTR